MLPINLKAAPNKVFAKVIEKTEKQLESGIILTGESVNQVMQDLRRAEVISSGVDFVKDGQVVVYLRYSGTDIGEEYIILDHTDILGTEVR